ncbi:MAG: divalent-cation tolerance protein CutA [Candidatus Methylacidiphilales bacterium]
MNLRIIITTLPDEVIAREIAYALIRSGLVVCAWVMPSMKSIYIWENVLNEESEYGLWVKTGASHVDHVFKMIQEMHPYECPGIFSLIPDQINETYARWAATMLGHSANVSDPASS